MRVAKTMSALVCLLVVSTAPAQTGAVIPPPGTNRDTLLKDVEQARKAEAEAKKNREEKEAAARAWLADTLRQFSESGLSGDIKPPKPAPDVNPVIPPTPAPIDFAGYRVLISFPAKLPEAQAAVVYGEAVRKELDRLCGKDGYRIWPEGTLAAGDAKLWQDAYARKRDAGKLWVVISTGKTGFEGPVADAPEMLAKLKSFEGK